MNRTPSATTRVVSGLVAGGLVACAGISFERLPDPARAYRAAVGASPTEIDGVPTSVSGVPLRGAAIDGEWRTYLGGYERSGTRVAAGIVEPEIAWATRVGIQGYLNTPLVSDDVIYVTSQGDTHDLGDPTDGFYALDARTGGVLWFTATQADVNGASMNDTLVVGGTDDGTLWAVDRATGARVWTASLGVPVRHGPLLSATSATVTTPTGYTLVRLRDGQVQHTLSFGGTEDWDLRGGSAMVGDTLVRERAGCAVDAIDDAGRARWSAVACAGDAGGTAHSYATPVRHGDAVLVASTALASYDAISVFVSRLALDDGSPMWTTPLVYDTSAVAAGYDWHYFAASPWVMAGTAWLPSVTEPRIVGLSVETGTAALEVALPRCTSRQFASIVGVPSRGYLARHDGYLYGFSPLTGQLHWTFYLGYRASAARFATGGFGPGHTTGCSGAPYDGSALFATPAVGADGRLYVGSGEGFLYAIKDAGWL